MPQDVQVESSPATETPIAASSIESLTSEQRSKWLMTGELPEPKPAESAPAKESSEPAASETDQAETSHQDSDPENKQAEQTPPKPKDKGADARKQQLHSEIQDLLRQRNDLRAEIDRAKPRETGEKKTAEPPPAEAKADANGKPDPTKFDTQEDYLEALAEWKIDQRERAKEAQTVAKTVREQYVSRAREVAKKPEYADFDEVISKADIALPEPLAEAMTTDEHGPELVYALAKDPDLAKKILSMSPIAAIREIGKLSASLAKPTAQPEKKVTAASNPPRELAAKAVDTVDEAEAALRDGNFPRYREIMNSRQLGKK